jgi:hypothetical protein
MLTALPNRERFRIDIEDPRLTKSRTDREDPSFDSP